MRNYILTIDPGSQMGWSIWRKPGNVLVKYGEFNTSPKTPRYDRLEEIVKAFNDLIEEWEPITLAIEDVARNLQGIPSADGIFWLVSTFTLATVKAYQSDISIVFISPSELRNHMGVRVMKKANPEYQDTKTQMVRKVNSTLQLEIPKAKHNTADAIALGLTYLDMDIFDNAVE